MNNNEILNPPPFKIGEPVTYLPTNRRGKVTRCEPATKPGYKGKYVVDIKTRTGMISGMEWNFEKR